MDMNKGVRFTDEFKRDAVAQVVERGYAVSEVAERLGMSTKSLYTWKSQFSKPSHVRAEVLDQAAEIRRLKRELARVTEERTILKRRPRTSRASLSEVRVY
jgi:transposase